MLNNALLDATIDELTGLYNRKVFQNESVARVLKRGIYSVLVIDGNKIKRINDKYGHHVGDEVISIIADAMQKVFRASDYLVRTGGDEFIVILPGCELEKAYILGDKLKLALAEHRLKSFDIDISVAIGIAVRLEHESLQDVIIRADKVLYENKHYINANKIV